MRDVEARPSHTFLSHKFGVPSGQPQLVLLSFHVRFILGVIGIMFALDALWWAASVRVARPAVARRSVAFFSLAQLTGLSWLLTQRFSHSESTAVFAKFAVAAVFIWHMIILPLLLLLALTLLPILSAVVVVRSARR